MPSFQELFEQSNGLPVNYKGNVILLVDRLPIEPVQDIRIIRESVNSNWKQGIHLATDGTFDINGRTIKKATVLWEGTAPREVRVRIRSKKSECLVKNVWDVGDGRMDSWHNGAAMIVEDIEGGRRYRCNDGHPDDDFDDLIFRIERLP